MARTRVNVVGLLIVFLLLIAILGVSTLYGYVMYGDWKCGMPGVHCRRMVQ